VIGMGKKSDKGSHILRAGHKEQRKDQQSEMRRQASNRADQRNARGKPPIRKN
jgi:hypothetical protein